MVKRRALVRLEPVGPAASRDQTWVKTMAPATRSGSAPDWIRTLKSAVKLPLQPEVPPDHCRDVRRIGGATHRVPPRKG